MFGFENIDLSFSYNSVWFFLALIILGGYAFYVYRYTVPAVSPAKRFLLAGIRTLALLLLLFIIFEPVLTLARKQILTPVNLVFADNSRSITVEDGTARESSVRAFLTELSGSSIAPSTELSAFGSAVLPLESMDSIRFSDGATNFSQIFSSIDNKNRSISSIVIISDGVITSGSNPAGTAEKLNIPVFTVGVGDTSRRNDIEIRNVQYNEFVYAEASTPIMVTLLNQGFGSVNIPLSLYEDGRLIETKNITLSENGTQTESFTYTPETGGEKKLTVTAGNREGEFTEANNRRIFYINVLDNKLNVLIAAGSPSPDISFIRNALKQDENIKVNSITAAAAGRFLENNDRNKLVDSADIFFLIGFPSGEFPAALRDRIFNAITARSKPYFLTLSGNTDFNGLAGLRNELSFSFSSPPLGWASVQPHVDFSASRHPLIQNNAAEPLAVWNNLPPVLRPESGMNAKPEANVIVSSKINNVPVELPLILTRSLGSRRSVSVLAKDIWKWKLLPGDKEHRAFESFILNSLKWLSTSPEQKQVTIKTSRKLYSSGEPVEFTAQVYDQTFNPVSDAEVTVNLKHENETSSVTLSSIGNGLYEGTFQTAEPGDYSFSGRAVLSGNSLGTDNGTFNIGEMDIEMVNPRRDSEFLASLARRTGGSYFDVSEAGALFRILEQRLERTSDEKINVSEISLWSSEWLMVIIIFLFAAEWFIRKLSSML